MTTTMIICIIISVFTIAMYMWGKYPIGLVSMVSMVLLVLTGCLSPQSALAGFSNESTIALLAMFPVVEGFNRTQFCKNIAGALARVAKGSLVKILAGYCVLAMILTQFIKAPMVVMLVICPMLVATCREIGVKPSKAVFPVGIVAISCCCILPIAAGATVAAEMDGYLQAAEYTAFQFGMFDCVKGRLPVLIASVAYSAFIGWRFAPDEPPIPPQNKSTFAEGAKLSKGREICGYVVFILTSITMLLQSKLGISLAVICISGALLMVITGVLSEADAIKAVPWNWGFIYIGALSLAAALAQTGVGDYVGAALANGVQHIQNRYLIGLIFFLIPFLLTQVMFNINVMMIFYPIVILTCKAMGGSPIGLMLLVQQACLTAFMTPLANGTVPIIMAEGGYDLRSMLKQSWLPSLVYMIVSVGWIMTVFPVL